VAYLFLVKHMKPQHITLLAFTVAASGCDGVAGKSGKRPCYNTSSATMVKSTPTQHCAVAVQMLPKPARQA
jgi:hypothetical protein